MRRTLLPILIVLWVFAWHGRALTGYFYGDDWFQITPRSGATVLKTFAGDWNMGHRDEGGFYRPLVRVSFALDRLVWGNDAAGYHLTGLLLLAVNALLVWALARRILHEEALALAAALGFVLLPTQAEVSWWISARADLLAGIGVLGALVLWCNPLKELLPFSGAARRVEERNASSNRAERPDSPAGFPPLRDRFAAWGLLIIGLMSKETAFAGLLLLPILDALFLSRFLPLPGVDPSEEAVASGLTPDRIVPVGRESGKGEGGFGGGEGGIGGEGTFRRFWVPWLRRSVVPAVGLGIVYFVWRTWSLGGIGGYLAGAREPMTVARIGETFREFLSGLVWPPGSGGNYGAHWKAWLIVFGGVLLISRFRRDLLFAIVGVLVSISPMAGLGLSPLAGGRYMLLPGAFGVLAWAALFSPALRQTVRPFRWVPAFILLLFCLLWTPVLIRAEGLWSAAAQPSRRSMEETWALVQNLPVRTPGQIGILPGPIPGNYHVWAAGYAMPVALDAWALSHGWKAGWGSTENPYPVPVVLHRPDGKTIRAWLGVPPDLERGAMVLRIDKDGQVFQFRVEDVSKRVFMGRDLAGWKRNGPGTFRGLVSAVYDEDSSTSAPQLSGSPGGSSLSAARFVIEGAGFQLIEPENPGMAEDSENAGERQSMPDGSTTPTAVEEGERPIRGPRWLVVGLTGTWNRPGEALLSSSEDPSHRRGAPAVSSVLPVASSEPVSIPVPPYFLYRTAFAQGQEGFWSPPWRLTPLSRPGRVTLERLELTEYLLKPIGP